MKKTTFKFIWHARIFNIDDGKKWSAQFTSWMVNVYIYSNASVALLLHCVLVFKLRCFTKKCFSWEIKECRVNIFHCLSAIKRCTNVFIHLSVIHRFSYVATEISSHSYAAGRLQSRMVLVSGSSFNIFHVSFTFSAAQYCLTTDL